MMINNDPNITTPVLEKVSLLDPFFGKRGRILQIVLLLLPVAFVVLAIFSFLSTPLRLVQPEANGQTPAVQLVGQRFLVEKAGLRSISIRLASGRELRSGLQLHLREPGATTDIRSTQAGEPESEGWLRFDFAPLDVEYQRKSLIFWIEATNSPIQLIWSERNVYREGDGYLDGVAQRGDLSFQLEYSPDPAGLLETYFERQSAYNGLAWVGLISLALWIGLALAGCSFLVLRRENFSAERIRQMRAKQFYPLGVYFLALTASGGLAFMFLTPPLQGLDEQGHLGRVMYVYQYQSGPTAFDQLYQAEYDLENRTRYVEYVPGFDYEVSALDNAIVPPLSERYQPPVYYAVAGGLVRLGAWLSGNQGLLLAQYMTRLASLLFGLGGLGIALGWVYYLRREAPWLVVAVPTAFALTPTYLFIIGVANNDNAVNFFVPLVILCLTVLYKEGYESRYTREFWQRWWPVAVIGLGSTSLALLSKHTSAAFLGGVALGVLVYVSSRLRRQVQLRLLAGIVLLALIGSIIVMQIASVQMGYVKLFLEGIPGKSQLLVIIQVLILTFESFWCSAGWVNFSDVADGRLMVGLFLLSLVTLWGIGRTMRRFFRTIGKTAQLYRGKPPWLIHLALTLGMALLIHFVLLVVFRIFTTYPRSPEVIEFPQGRFFLQGLLVLSALIFGGLRAALPVRLRQQVGLWAGFYLWFLGLLVYGLLMLFGGFLPYYYNLY